MRENFGLCFEHENIVTQNIKNENQYLKLKILILSVVMKHSKLEWNLHNVCKSSYMNID